MDSEKQSDLTNDAHDSVRQMTDPAYDASATGLAGVPTASVTEDTSRTGVAGSSTFDPRVSPAHEGLAGSPSYYVGSHDSAHPDSSVGLRGARDDQP